MSDQIPFHELSNLRKYAKHIRWIVDAYSMGEPVKDKLRLTAEVLDAEAKEHDALLAVKEEYEKRIREEIEESDDGLYEDLLPLHSPALAALPEKLK